MTDKTPFYKPNKFSGEIHENINSFINIYRAFNFPYFILLQIAPNLVALFSLFYFTTAACLYTK